MKALNRKSRVSILTGAMLILAVGAARGEIVTELNSEPLLIKQTSAYSTSEFDDMEFEVLPCEDGECCTCGDCAECEMNPEQRDHGFYGAGEYLYLRAHFSEAIAFARVDQSVVGGLVNVQATAEELDFDYDSSLRTFVGYDLSDVTDVRFTYFYYDDEVSVDGVAAGPGQFLVDPFGNIGAEINTTASVKMNVFDIDLAKTFHSESKRLALRAAAGVRGADIDQYYDSVAFNAGGATAGEGEFLASFTGVGPRFDLQSYALFGPRNQFALTARGAASILVGNYDVSSFNSFTGLLAGGQSASRTRAVPVLEGELGASWRPASFVSFSGGWLFQSWFNVGTSGGTFNSPFDTPDAGNIFGGADDSDIMSFDGLFARAEVDF